jgi:hypothetical protein
MSEFLWCPECRQSFLDEERVFFAQRCRDCGGLLERDEPGRCEVDYKEVDSGYQQDDGDEEEDEQEAEDIYETETDAASDPEGE